MLSRERVLEILKETDVLQEGHFILTSGRHSHQYMQCAKILQYPWYTEEIIKGLAQEFKDEEIDIVIGPAMGGIIIAYELARALKAKNIFAERENGKMALRRGFSIPKGAKVVVAEDVITTGGSVKEVMEIVEKQGGILKGVALLVDRSNGSIDFGVKTASALAVEVISYEAENCPLCKEGKIPAIKPGSRSIVK